MLADGHYIDHCDVAFVIPMKLSVTPLLSTFATLGTISISEQQNAPLTYPLNKNKMSDNSGKDPSKRKYSNLTVYVVANKIIYIVLEKTRRLKQAEDVLFKEKELQKKLTAQYVLTTQLFFNL